MQAVYLWSEQVFLHGQHCVCTVISQLYCLFGVQAGGSGVVVSPITYIFEEEPVRWRKLLDSLNLKQ